MFFALKEPISSVITSCASIINLPFPLLTAAIPSGKNMQIFFHVQISFLLPFPAIPLPSELSLNRQTTNSLEWVREEFKVFLTMESPFSHFYFIFILHFYLTWNLKVTNNILRKKGTACDI